MLYFIFDGLMSLSASGSAYNVMHVIFIHIYIFIIVDSIGPCKLRLRYPHPPELMPAYVASLTDPFIASSLPLSDQNNFDFLKAFGSFGSLQ